MIERLVALQVDDKDSYGKYREGMTPLLEACGGILGHDFEIAEAKGVAPPEAP